MSRERSNADRPEGKRSRGGSSLTIKHLQGRRRVAGRRRIDAAAPKCQALAGMRQNAGHGLLGERAVLRGFVPRPH